MEVIKKLRKLANRSFITTGLELVGMISVTTGVLSVSVSAGLVVAGLFLIAIGYFTS
jgi:hypothetical protein